MSPVPIYPDAHPESTTVDGVVANETIASAGNGVSWADIRNSVQMQGAAPSLATFQCQIVGHQDTDKWQGLFRTILLYDLSSIGSPIHELTLTILGSTKSDALNIAPNINVYESSPATNTNLIGSDTGTISTTPLCDTPIAYDDWDVAPSTANAPNDFVFNAAGLALAEAARLGDGILKIGLRNANYDVANIEPAWSNNTSSLIGHSADKGGDFRPKLVVTYGYPTNPISRLSGIVYRYGLEKQRPARNRLTMEMFTGGLSTGYTVPRATGSPDPAIAETLGIIFEHFGLQGPFFDEKGTYYLLPGSTKRYYTTGPYVTPP